MNQNPCPGISILFLLPQRIQKVLYCTKCDWHRLRTCPIKICFFTHFRLKILTLRRALHHWFNVARGRKMRKTILVASWRFRSFYNGSCPFFNGSIPFFKGSGPLFSGSGVPFDGCGVSIHKFTASTGGFEQQRSNSSFNSTVAVCSGTLPTRWRYDTLGCPGWHPCFWIEMRLVVINPGSVTETWLPDMWVTAAVPDINR